MMSRVKAGFIVLAAAILASIIGCLHDSDAHDGPTLTEVQKLIADAVGPLEDRIEALESQVASLTTTANRTTMYSPSGGGGSGKFSKTSNTVDVGTVLDVIPANPFQPKQYTMLSTTGYQYGLTDVYRASVPIDYLTGGGLGIEGVVYYETIDCTGQAYVRLGNDFTVGITRDVARRGVVFRIGAGQLNGINDDPNQYFYVPEGATDVMILAQSRTNNVDFCETLNPAQQLTAFAAHLNDPGVTGVENAPIPGPLALGQ